MAVSDPDHLSTGASAEDPAAAGEGAEPLYYYVAQFRDLIYGCHLPGPRIFFGGWIIAFLMLIIGVTVSREKDKFILYI